jgi:hypothetical protein
MSAIALLPNPTEADLTCDTEQVACDRHLDCRYYDRCLLVAVREGWSGFSCTACPAYESESAKEQLRDGLAVRRYLSIVEAGDG